MPNSSIARIAAVIVAAALVAPAVASAQAPMDVGAGAKNKKADKKASLFNEKMKKEKKKRPKADPNAVTKGEFNYEKLEQLSFDARARRLQQNKSKARQNLINTMERLVARKGGGARYKRMAGIYFRLAETYWGETHYQYLLARDRYNKEMLAFDKKIRSTKPTEPVENYQKSIEYYEKVLREFPNYQRIDEVMYRLGKAALSQGKALGDKVLSNKGVQYLNQLVQKHQQSRYISNAHLALAEHFFDSNNLTLAKMNYEQIVQNYKGSPMFNYALYKLGWVYYNLREFRRTVETFQAVVREISKLKGKALSFKEQALKDLVPAYSELERGWPEAKAYFTKVEGEKGMWKRLERLAAIYVANDKQDLAIELHSHFIESKPTDPRCVDWYETIIDIYLGLEEFNGIAGAIRKFLAFTDERTSAWVAANKNNEDAMEKSAELGEKYLLYMSNYYHQKAQKVEDETKSLDAARELYVKAGADYKEFVRRYPHSKKAYIVSFYYAEILYSQLKDYEGARQQYKRVIDRDRKGEYLEDAALGVIYSVENLLKQTHARYDYDKNVWIKDPTAPALIAVQTSEGGSKVTKTKRKKGDGVSEEEIKGASVPKKRQELHPLEQDFVGAADKYVALMVELKKSEKCRKKKKWCKKKGRDVPGIMYLAAATYYERGQYPKSIERLEIVYRYDQKRIESEIAVKTLIDIYARQKNWVKIEEWARKMLDRRKNRLFKKKDLRKYVAISVGEQARDLAERKDFDGAHAKYDTILREFRRDEPELAAVSLFNKAAIYEIQKEEKKAIQTYERVVKEFKKSKVAPEAMFNIGMIYEAQTQFKEAAASFLRMAKIRKNSDAAQALINAGAILKALRQPDQAVKAFTAFMKLAPKIEAGPDTARLRALIPDAQLEIGRVWETAGNLKKAKKAYKNVAKKFSNRPELQVEAIGRLLKLMVAEDDARKRPKNKKKIIKSIEAIKVAFAKPGARKGNAAYYFAMGLFQSAEFLYNDFKKLTLRDVKNARGLKGMLEKQAIALKKAEISYFSVIDATAAGQGKDYAACAAFKVGLLYYTFKEDLFNAPLPKQVERAVDAGFYEVEERYRHAIEQVAAPIEEQSLVALRGAIRTAHNLGAYNKCSRQAGEYAAKVNPDEYPTVEKDPNLPKATTALNPNKTTNTSTSAAFITRVRRGKFTVDFKPSNIQVKQKKAAKRQ
ncbi:MAG: DUF3808 domain-containing protein [Myxococcales bacterium]|nr:DUF3808 domain-containing protein [Myxococcales bacterium]